MFFLYYSKRIEGLKKNYYKKTNTERFNMNFIDFIKEIKQSNLSEEERQIHLDTINQATKAFTNYFNSVVDMEIFSTTITTWDSFAEYVFKNKDEKRRQNHDMCIYYCQIINGIAQSINSDLYIDTELRHEVACFVGDALSSLYSKGIDRSFDELVKQYSKEQKFISDSEIGEL